MKWKEGSYRGFYSKNVELNGTHYIECLISNYNLYRNFGEEIEQLHPLLHKKC